MSEVQIKASNINDINLKDIVLSKKKKHNKVPIHIKSPDQSDTPLVFQTPYLEVVGGLTETPFNTIHTLITLFAGLSTSKVVQWQNFIEKVESMISKQIIENGTNWFTQSNVVIKSIIKDPDAELPVSYIKWPLDMSRNIFVDETGSDFDPDNLRDKDLIRLIVEIPNLWIRENQCGLAAIVRKIKVKPQKEKIECRYLFEDSDNSSDKESDKDSDDEKIVSLLATEQNPAIRMKADISSVAAHAKKYFEDEDSVELVESTKAPRPSQLKQHSHSKEANKSVQSVQSVQPIQSVQSIQSPPNPIKLNKKPDARILTSEKNRPTTFKQTISDLSDDFALDHKQRSSNNKFKGYIHASNQIDSSSSNDDFGDLNVDDLDFDS